MPRKRFCLHGHDTDVCGRTASNRCYECYLAYFRRTRATPRGRLRMRQYKRAQRARDRAALAAGVKAALDLSFTLRKHELLHEYGDRFI